MDNLRLILLFALSFVLLLIYQAWMRDYGQVAPTAAPITAPAPGSSLPAVAPPDVPAVSSGTEAITAEKAEVSALPSTIHVETDVARVQISTRGGTLSNLWLKDYWAKPENPDVPFQLLKADQPNLYLVQSGLIGATPDEAPTHDAIFTSSSANYTLAEGKSELSVDLVWTHPSGVTVTKRFVFRRGSFVVEMTQTVENRSNEPWSARAYYQFQRSEPHDPTQSSFIYTYTGAAYYSPEDKYEKVTFENIAERRLEKNVSSGWVAMVQHYFLGALIPPQDTPQTVYTNRLDGPRYLIGYYGPAVQVAPGDTQSFSSQLYAGPQLQKDLAKLSPGLELTVDYGWLTVIAQPIFWLLDKLHALVGNWGVAIILLTVLIKAAFFKLSETSYRSMANMRKLTPRLQALKDRYGDDKERMNQAMMEMYKKEKVNPLGGCLPILVQIPVFIALYWVLLESVELRQAPFALWIQTLSTPDPYYVLPLIMGVSMFLQQKLNPAPLDPLQAKIMMSLPIVFTVFFAFFPSGLVLYWTVNNVLSIAQQWHITRKIEAGAKA